jgi:hypothetical protein
MDTVEKSAISEWGRDPTALLGNHVITVDRIRRSAISDWGLAARSNIE